MSKADMDAVLDDLGIPPGDGDADIENEELEEEFELEEEEDLEEELEGDPPGFISHADYVEKHGNDDGWKGKDAYSAEYDRIQDNKSLRSDVKTLTNLVQSTVDATTQMQDDRYEQGMAAARAEYKDAIDNNDAVRAVAAADVINKMPAPQTAPQVNPIHAQFFESNPMLDKGSESFDQEVMGEFARIYDGRLRADGVQPQDQLSEVATKGYMKAALASAKSLFPDKFESPRNTRRTSGKIPKRGKNAKAAAGDGIKNMKIATKNSRDTSALSDVYEAIKAKDPTAAEEFAKRMQS